MLLLTFASTTFAALREMHIETRGATYVVTTWGVLDEGTPQQVILSKGSDLSKVNAVAQNVIYNLGGKNFSLIIVNFDENDGSVQKIDFRLEGKFEQRTIQATAESRVPNIDPTKPDVVTKLDLLGASAKVDIGSVAALVK